MGYSLTSVLSTVAAIASAIAAVALIYLNRTQTRLLKGAHVRALIDLMIQQKADRDLRQATANVNAWHRAGIPLTRYQDPKHKERKDIMRVLNNQEFIAVGIRLGCFDENSYKQMQCSIVLRLWDACEEFIKQIRQHRKSETPYQDFERLALRWKKDPIKHIASKS